MIVRERYGPTLMKGLHFHCNSIQTNLLEELITILKPETWQAYLEETYSKLRAFEQKRPAGELITSGIYAIWLADSSQPKGGNQPEYSKTAEGHILMLVLQLFDGPDWYGFAKLLEDQGVDIRERVNV